MAISSGIDKAKKEAVVCWRRAFVWDFINVAMETHSMNKVQSNYNF